MKHHPRIITGALAGVASGLVASAVMNVFQRNLSKLFGGEQRSHGAQSEQIGSPSHGAAAYLRRRGADSPEDDAAERTANMVSLGLAGHELSEEEKDVGGTIFHYAFGAASGAIYGVASELFPSVRSGWGLPFGGAVWIIADEGVVPALGLSKHARNYSVSTISYALAAHLVYGLATEATLRLMVGPNRTRPIPERFHRSRNTKSASSPC